MTKNNKNINLEIKMYDIIISGASYAGCALAVALKQACPHFNILLIESQPQSNIVVDERSSSLSPMVINMLQALELWEDIKAQAQPVVRMIITDSDLEDPIRKKILTFSEEEDADDKAPLLYMMPNHILLTALKKKLEKLNIDILYDTTITKYGEDTNSMSLYLSDGQHISSKILVAADGKRSKLREQAGLTTYNYDYHQTALVFNISHSLSNNQTAIQHFLADGPLALLPLSDNKSSVVWSMPHKKARRFLEGEKFFFLKNFKQILGHDLGDIALTDKLQSFPLSLTFSYEFVKSRLYLVGDAARSIHPLAGQGLSLGFYDVAILAELIVDYQRLGLEISSSLVAENYQRARRFESLMMATTTHLINKFFSNDSQIMRFVRDASFQLVDNKKLLKEFFMSQMSQVTADMPKLLIGEKL